MNSRARDELRDGLRQVGGRAALLADVVSDDLDARAFDVLVPAIVRALKLEIYGPAVRPEGGCPRATDDPVRPANGGGPNGTRRPPAC